jgi:hypothetical protein
VDQHVAGVDEHPVALRQALDTDVLDARVFELVHNVIGQCADVSLRAAAGDDHQVRNRGLAANIDAEDVLCLVVFQRRLGQAGYGVRSSDVFRRLCGCLRGPDADIRVRAGTRGRETFQIRRQ